MKHFLIINVCAFLITLGVANADALRSNQINGFEFTSCLTDSCVIVHAPKAYMGMQLDVFSTTGRTTLDITDRVGHVRSKYVGTSAMLNTQLQTIVFENEKSGFILYSLKDGQLSDYMGGSK